MNLINQVNIKTSLTPVLQLLKTQLEARQSVWNKTQKSKKVAWVKSGKDPVMTLAYQTYKYLDKFFGRSKDDLG